MLTADALTEIIEDPLLEWGEEVYYEDDEEIDDGQITIANGDENNRRESVVDGNGSNQESRPGTTTKSVASSLRSDGKRLKLKVQRQPVYTFGGAPLKRDPIVESIIESRKYSIVENTYTRLAHITSQAPRLSQRANPFEIRSSIPDIDNEIKEKIINAHGGMKFPSSTTSEFDNDKWDDRSTAEHEKETTQSIDKLGVHLYEQTCKRLNICPCSMVLRSLNTTKINLGNYGLGSKGCAALAVALIHNTAVLSLNLSRNNIGSNGMSYIYQILQENTYIEEYDLSFNNLGTKGIWKLAEGMTHCAQVKTLNVAGNGLNATDIQILLSKLEDHPTLNHLNLSYNQLEEEGSIYLAKWLIDNSTLISLDISWCSIRLSGAKAIAKSIGDNNRLLKLDLSYNSFTNDTIEFITESLLRNLTLSELDLRGNQFICRYNSTIKDDPSILIVGKDSHLYHMIVAASTNQSLKILRLGHNHIDTRCLMILLETLSKMDNITLEELDLTGLTVTPEQIEAVDFLFANHPVLRCYVGPIRQPIEHYVNNLLNLIYKHMDENQTGLSDLFNPNEGYTATISTVTYEQFVNALRKAKIPFPAALINDMMEYLGKDNEPGIISLRSLVIT